jgi:hypothetical protein
MSDYDTFNAKAWMRRALDAESELKLLREAFRCFDCGDRYTPLVCRNCCAKAMAKAFNAAAPAKRARGRTTR